MWALGSNNNSRWHVSVPAYHCEWPRESEYTHTHSHTAAASFVRNWHAIVAAYRWAQSKPYILLICVYECSSELHQGQSVFLGISYVILVGLFFLSNHFHFNQNTLSKAFNRNRKVIKKTWDIWRWRCCRHCSRSF